MTSRDKTEVGKAIRVGDHTLIPIERTILIHGDHESGRWCYASKRLVALVVRSAKGDQAFELETGPITMDQIWSHPIDRWSRASEHEESNAEED